MSGFKVAFQPLAGQGEALGAAGSGAARLAQELRDLAAALGCYGGMDAFAAALSALGEGVEDCGGRISALGARLEEIRDLYLRTEEGLAGQMDGAASGAVGTGTPSGAAGTYPGGAYPGGSGATAPYPGSTYPGGSGAVGTYPENTPGGTGAAGTYPGGTTPSGTGATGPYLGAVTPVSAQRDPESSPVENAQEDSPYGGVTGALEEAWNWVKEDHSLWEAGVSGSALGGMAVGSAAISALHYESEFTLGDEYSKETNRSFDGTQTETEEGISMGIGAGGSVSLLHAGAEGRFGGDYLGIYGEASGDVGVVTAGGTVGVFADEDGLFAGAQGELGAYAAQGEVTGGLDLGFMKIGGSLEGSVGFGVSGEIGFDDGEFTIGASATPGLGGGFSLSIDLSPTIDWIQEFF